jgi:DNA-binding XRE family transcriptional regulator
VWVRPGQSPVDGGATGKQGHRTIIERMRRWDWVEDWGDAEQGGLRVIAKAVNGGRLRAHMTQAQLGYRTGLNQSTISRLETGRLRTMRMVTLARIIGVLRLGPDVLIPGEPPRSERRLPGESGA